MIVMMKTRKILILPLLLVATCAGVTSCGVDRWAEYAAQTELDEWIAATMRENYLWYADMPEDKKVNFFSAPDAFLKSVVSPQDYNMSYIDSLLQAPLPSYGFDYSLYRAYNNDTAYNALITYILPNSPAEKAQLKRGQWIMKVNDEYITKKSEPLLLESGKALHLLVGKYTRQIDEETETEVGVVVETGTAEMGAEQPIEDNPINTHTVITTSNGIKVGYLVYSRFTAGTTADGEVYNNQLRALSREFADAGVTHFILDLRYNTGGSLACAQLLSTLLAPASALGTPFASLEYNNKQTDKSHKLLFDPKLIGEGTNLNISRGFILTSSATAGIAGVMMNCLIPLERWTVVGSPLSCYGVATESFIRPQHPWSLNPVVCTVLNSNNESNRLKSVIPEAEVDENSNLLTFLPFGDPKESVLSIALGIIDGSYPPAPEEPEARMRLVKNVINTPSRKAAGRSTLQ